MKKPIDRAETKTQIESPYQNQTKLNSSGKKRRKI